MSDESGLGPVPQRIQVDADVVRRLVADQLPHWSHLPVSPVALGGWDNHTFHLGDTMLVRLPSAEPYALAVEKEHRWLPILAAASPVPTPAPLALGRPSADYPHPWSVYAWLPGRTASTERIADHETFAHDLGAFVAALRSVDATDGPQPGLHNWYRGGSLHTFDRDTRARLVELDGRLDVDLTAVAAAWDDALAAPWDGVDRWFHGDLAAGNILLDERGALGAVIDFGTCGVGDPACDLAVAWTLMTRSGRQSYRNALAVDDATWRRGRGWALWKALATGDACLDEPDDAQELADAEHVLHMLARDG